MRIDEGKGRDILGAARGSYIINGTTEYSGSDALAYYVLESGSKVSSITDQDDNEISHLVIYDTGSSLSAGTLITSAGLSKDSYFKTIAITGSLAVIKK